jgi:hypothetical protein
MYTDDTNRALVTVMIIILFIILLAWLLPRVYVGRTASVQRVVPATVSTPWYRTISTSLTPVRTTPVQTYSQTSTNTYYPPATVTYTPGTTNTYTCPADAMQCPDGSYVGRTGPQCQFSPCPGTR